MIFKIIVVILLLFILFSLGSALTYLVRDKGKSDRVFKSLAWRIGLSVFLFLLLILGSLMGWIQPHTLAP